MFDLRNNNVVLDRLLFIKLDAEELVPPFVEELTETNDTTKGGALKHG